MRTILIHLNLQVPDDAPCSVRDVVTEINGALEIGMSENETPALYSGHYEITLAEEV